MFIITKIYSSSFEVPKLETQYKKCMYLLHNTDKVDLTRISDSFSTQEIVLFKLYKHKDFYKLSFYSIDKHEFNEALSISNLYHYLNNNIIFKIKLTKEQHEKYEQIK